MLRSASLLFPSLLTCLTFLALLSDESSAASPQPHLVMLVAEREYETDQTLPVFVKKHLDGKFKTSFVFADSNDLNSLPEIGAVESADVLLISVRRRTLPKQQLDIVRRYVAAGKPVIGIRTANHAFCLRKGDPPEGRVQWREWDQEVFGGNYSNHYGNQLKVTLSLNRDSKTSAVLLGGIEPAEPITAGGSLYQVSPLASGAQVCLTGRVQGNPPEPVAWTFVRADGGKSFYTSLGHVDDFQGVVLPQLLLNALAWATE